MPTKRRSESSDEPSAVCVAGEIAHAPRDKKPRVDNNEAKNITSHQQPTPRVELITKPSSPTGSESAFGMANLRLGSPCSSPLQCPDETLENYPELWKRQEIRRKNREAAKLSRRRHKEVVVNLEDELKGLKAQYTQYKNHYESLFEQHQYDVRRGIERNTSLRHAIQQLAQQNLQLTMAQNPMLNFLQPLPSYLGLVPNNILPSIGGLGPHQTSSPQVLPPLTTTATTPQASGGGVPRMAEGVTVGAGTVHPMMNSIPPDRSDTPTDAPCGVGRSLGEEVGHTSDDSGAGGRASMCEDGDGIGDGAGCGADRNEIVPPADTELAANEENDSFDVEKSMKKEESEGEGSATRTTPLRDRANGGSSEIGEMPQEDWMSMPQAFSSLNNL